MEFKVQCSWKRTLTKLLAPASSLVARRRKRIFILPLARNPIKRQKLHFYACGINGMYESGKETDGGVKLSRGNTVWPMKKPTKRQLGPD